MKRGIDANVLVYAHLASVPEHRQVRSFLESQLRDAAVTLVVTPQVLQEFVHVVTDVRRFDPPLDMTEAIGVADLYLRNLQCVATDREAAQLAFERMSRYSLGRRRIADTVLYATLKRHGVEELITCNPSDFRVFEDLGLIDPLS